MRLLTALFLSFSICIGIFFGMHLMTSSSTANVNKKTKTHHLVYLREKRDSDIQKKKRIKPKEPKKVIPKKLRIVKTKIAPKVNPNVKIKPFKTVAKNIDVSSISSLNGALVNIGLDLLDARTLQAKRKGRAKYPRRAKLKKIEGYVQLVFDIDTKGNVSNIQVVEAKPKDIFNASAVKAMQRYKFKEMKEQRTATMKFNYRLAR